RASHEAQIQASRMPNMLAPRAGAVKAPAARDPGTPRAENCPSRIGTGAHLTVLWGTTPIALAFVAEGRTVSVSGSGIVGRSPPRGRSPGGLAIRVDARGASVVRAGSGDAGSIVPVGTEARFVLAPRPGSVYRCGDASQPEALALHVGVTAGEARP